MIGQVYTGFDYTVVCLNLLNVGLCGNRGLRRSSAIFASVLFVVLK